MLKSTSDPNAPPHADQRSVQTRQTKAGLTNKSNAPQKLANSAHRRSLDRRLANLTRSEAKDIVVELHKTIADTDDRPAVVQHRQDIELSKASIVKSNLQTNSCHRTMPSDDSTHAVQ